MQTQTDAPATRRQRGQPPKNLDYAALRKSILKGQRDLDAVIDEINDGPPKRRLVCALPSCDNVIIAYRSRIRESLRDERNIYCSKVCNARRDRMAGSGKMAEHMRRRRRERIEARNVVRAAQTIIREMAQPDNPNPEAEAIADKLESVVTVLTSDASTVRRAELTASA